MKLKKCRSSVGQATGVAAAMALKGAARVQDVDSVALTGNLARHGVAGGSGIGHAVATAFEAEGAHVWIADTSNEALSTCPAS